MHGRRQAGPAGAGGRERPRAWRRRVPAASRGPAHVHPQTSVTALKTETNAPLLFVVLSVSQSCRFSLVLNQGELGGPHK